MRRQFCARMALTGVILLTLFALSARATPIVQAATSVRDIANPDAYTCAKPGYINFESLPDNKNLSSDTISGVQFTTTGGFTWLIGDFSTGYYNGKYPAGAYTSQGTHWAWLGPSQGSGRIDFPQGKPSYFSLLVSGLTPVYLEAYNASGTLLERAGPTASNTSTGHMGELAIARSQADIDHVLIHDTGNYFLVDAVCTNAASVPTAQALRWPWPPDQSWHYNTGPHDADGLDFQPDRVNGCGTDGVGSAKNFWVYPVAKGKIIDARRPAEKDDFGHPANTSSPVSLSIQHDDGTISFYSHLANSPIKIEWDTKGTAELKDDRPTKITPSTIDMTQPLGNPSCFHEVGYYATGAHLHFGYKKGSDTTEIYRTSFCGWQLVTIDPWTYKDGDPASGKLPTIAPIHLLRKIGHADQYPKWEMSDYIPTGVGPGTIDNNCAGANSATRQTDHDYFMNTGNTASGTFLVDVVSGALQSIDVFVGPFGSDVDLVLTRPDGSRVSPTDSGVQYSKTSTSISYAITDALAGKWTYQIIADQLEAGGEDIRIVADEYNGASPTPPDTTPPTIDCAAPDGLWHASNVSITCTASDAESGLAIPADASFTLSTSVPDETETANAATSSHQVCDVAGNCATAGPIAGNNVDKKAPTISITIPVSATPYLLHQAVAVNYSCADGGSGVASCTGPVANGGALDTITVGAKTFNVAAADQVGNASNQTVNYTVTYNICALYDQTKAVNGGATIPVKLQLCDAQGANVSASTLTVTAVKVTQTSTSTSGPVQNAGNANPDSNFRYDPTLGGTGGYIYNLSTKGLATGTYTLSFTVAGDPVTHTVRFQVR